jgi:hypothetical protein
VIVVDEATRLRIVTQPDHARFAADMLSLWRADGLPDHPRRDDLLFATREHDNGWREPDAAPRVDPEQRRPLTFLSYPEADRLELWARGIHRFAAERPLAALLIAEHAEAVHRPLSDAWERFFDELESYRALWLEEVGVDRSTVRLDYRFLGLADTLSLALCSGEERRLEGLGVDARMIGQRLELRPFPLAGTTTFEIPVRRVANRPYESDTRFAVALARAPWERQAVKIAPFSDTEP